VAKLQTAVLAKDNIYICIQKVDKSIQMLPIFPIYTLIIALCSEDTRKQENKRFFIDNTDEEIKNEQSRETGNIGDVIHEEYKSTTQSHVESRKN
jgi:hypothetical protein